MTRHWSGAPQPMIILQALVNGIVSGTLLAVPAIGFTAMFAVLRFPNFSVSGVATLGAFAGYLAYGAGLQWRARWPSPSPWRAWPALPSTRSRTCR